MLFTCSHPDCLRTGLSWDFVLLQGCRLGLLRSDECGDVFLHQTQVVSQCCHLWMLADGGDGSDLNWSCTHTSGSAECLQHRHQPVTMAFPDCCFTGNALLFHKITGQNSPACQSGSDSEPSSSHRAGLVLSKISSLLC